MEPTPGGPHAPQDRQSTNHPRSPRPPPSPPPSQADIGWTPRLEGHMRRKTVRAATPLGALAFCLTAAACSGGESATEQAAETGESGDSSQSSGPAGGTSVIGHWQHHSDARAKLVEDFVADYDGAKIDFQSIPYESYFQKLG